MGSIVFLPLKKSIEVQSFSNKTAWVTGASSGIGEQLVYALAKAGAKVIVSSRKQADLVLVKANCPNPENILVLPFDLTDEGGMEKVAAQAKQFSGRIDFLFNNGGVSQRSVITETQMDVYHRLMNINYFGTVALTKSVLPIMLENKSGKIIVISSLMGKFASPLRSGYAAAKHALHGFFDSLRLEMHEHNIGVLLVCPGFVKTNISVNSVTADGSKHNEMDNAQATGMTAQECAEKILKAVRKDKHEVYLGGKEIIAVYLKRYLPGVLHKILLKSKVT